MSVIIFLILLYNYCYSLSQLSVTAVTVKGTLLWDVKWPILVEIHWCFEETTRLHEAKCQKILSLSVTLYCSRALVIDYTYFRKLPTLNYDYMNLSFNLYSCNLHFRCICHPHNCPVHLPQFFPRNSTNEFRAPACPSNKTLFQVLTQLLHAQVGDSFDIRIEYDDIRVHPILALLTSVLGNTNIADGQIPAQDIYL